MKQNISYFKQKYGEYICKCILHTFVNYGIYVHIFHILNKQNVMILNSTFRTSFSKKKTGHVFVRIKGLFFIFVRLGKAEFLSQI